MLKELSKTSIRMKDMENDLKKEFRKKFFEEDKEDAKTTNPLQKSSSRVEVDGRRGYIKIVSPYKTYMFKLPIETLGSSYLVRADYSFSFPEMKTCSLSDMRNMVDRAEEIEKYMDKNIPLIVEWLNKKL